MTKKEIAKDLFWATIAVVCGYLVVKYATPLWDFLGVNPQ